MNESEARRARQTEARRAFGLHPTRSWWRGPWPPTILLLTGMGFLAWELSWALPLLGGR
ncbi:hypothetical protein ACEYYH_10420 [Microbacterium trichothecenolyticum]|uniref:hypothetical protein n=1 Tax=Microbacterium trichothecenolyticum TaxID=69370 RepID=UPI0035BE57FD